MLNTATATLSTPNAIIMPEIRPAAPVWPAIAYALSIPYIPMFDTAADNIALTAEGERE